MFTRLSVFIARVLLGLLLLLLCQFPLNIHGISTVYAKATHSTYQLYEQLIKSKRITPDNYEPKEYTIPMQPTVYLTFDDGPSVETPKVLDILQKEGIKASFFVLGKMAEEHPEMLKRVAKDGHAIGNHTYNHVYKQLYGHIDEFWRQIQQTEKIIYDISGIRPELVRAPGGTFTNFNAFYYYDMDEAGYTMMDWNMDSGDSSRANVPAQEIVDRVKQSTLKHEVILLMHDGSGHGQTVKALPEIIDYFKKKGYVFAPLTTTVKPMQSPISKYPWVSSYSYDQFVVQEDKVLEHVMEHQNQLAAAKQKEAEISLKNKLYAPNPGITTVIGADLGWNNLANLTQLNH